MNNINLPLHYVRATAITIVLLFHTTWFTFTGGYVGVDMFFILSGFLIAEKISHMTQFSDIKTFYRNRAIKIFPPLIATIVLTVALFWLLWGWCEDTITFLTHGILSILGASNIEYMLNATPTPFSYSPLLHLWSIAIEVQFYIFAPLIYLAIKNKTVHRKVLIITAAASFLTYLTLLTINPTFAYYFTGSRIWLFALGALIFMTPIPQIMVTKTKQLTVTAATVIIAYMLLYPYITPQVTLLTLMPILATALIIFLHKNSTRINRSEAKKFIKPVILLADISYPLYLIHYPVFFFTHHYYPNLMLPAVIFSILAAWLMHALIEKPAVTWNRKALHPSNSV